MLSSLFSATTGTPTAPVNDKVVVKVRYAHGGKNALPIQCHTSETVMELAKRLKQNADLFGLESQDVRLDDLDLFLVCKDGKQRLELNQDITCVGELEIEFDNHPVIYDDILIKYHTSINPVRISCNLDAKVFDLGDLIIKEVERFKLSKSDAVLLDTPGNEIQILQSHSDGNVQPVDPTRCLSDFKDQTLLFRVLTKREKERGNRVKVTVRYLQSDITTVMSYWENDQVTDLLDDIKERVSSFEVTDSVARDVHDPRNSVQVSTWPVEGHPRILGHDELMTKFDGMTLVWSVEPILDVHSIDEIRRLCNGQNIAFFGAVGHGKSSSINTLAEALGHGEVTDTWGASGSAGTLVVSPHTITFDQSSTVTLVDVPGSGLPRVNTQHGSNQLKDVIGWIMDGKFPQKTPTDYWERGGLSPWKSYFLKPKVGRIDAVVIIIKATAQVDRMINIIVSESKNRGNGIPIHTILTHVDQLRDRGEIKKKVKEVSRCIGVEETRIYPLSNRVRGGDYLVGNDRDTHVLCMLAKLLRTATHFQSNENRSPFMKRRANWDSCNTPKRFKR